MRITSAGFEHIDSLTERAVAVKELFIETLKRASSASPVRSSELEKSLNITGPEVRAISQWLTESGLPIASRSARPAGYWWARSSAEMLAKRDHLRSRKQSLERHIEATERVANNMRMLEGVVQERLI